jgi:uncharacterized membrane protein
MAEKPASESTERDEAQNGTNQGGRSRLSSLASKDVLLPAAATAATAAAAGLVAKKGPDLMRMITGEAKEEAEDLGRAGAQGAKQGLGGGGIAGKAASKLLGGSSRGGQSGGKTRRLPIQRYTDVAVPVAEAYERWTNFEEFPKFMHRVLEVREEEDDKIHWREKIWFSTREWDGEITERRKNDRIAWKSVSGTQHSGVVSFHKLDTNLTRVLVTVDFVPSGILEKAASGMRFVKRAVEADLARFKAYVEFGNAKDLEYRAKPEEMEQHRSGDDNEEARGEGGDDSSSRSDDDGERESQRQERESRRQERRKALSPS